MATTKEPKLTAGEKRAQKRRETAEKMETIFGTGKGSTEPTIDPLDYTTSLMRALNYYNAAFDNKDKRKWVISYVGKANASKYENLSDYEFRSVGTIIRLKQRGQPLQTKDEEFITARLEEMARLSAEGVKYSALKGEPEDKPAKVIVSVQDRIKESAGEHIGEFNGLIDEFVMTDTIPDFEAYLKSNNISGAVSKHIPAAFEKTLAELEEVLEGADKQLVEGYSHIKKTKLKKLIAIVKSISDACAQQAVSAKAARKPRARKEKPASVIAAKVKYLKEFADLKLKSVAPVNIVGSSETWLYNTKYKKLQVYRAVGDGKLSIKGTTILNYEVATSGSKTMRKPELVTGYANMTKRNLANEFKNLKTKESAVNGRINEDCIILKVF
jgi:hypothetical protein